MSMRYLDRNDVRLAYEEAGRGQPPLLCVHGWSCDHEDFAPQLAHFSHAHRVVTVDLRGHGQSDHPVQEYSMTAFADDCAWLCDRLGLVRPVVLGHSMGGLVTMELAARYPELVRAVVLLDAPVILRSGGHVLRQRVVEGLHGHAYAETARDYARSMFHQLDGEAIRARVLAKVAAMAQHVSASELEHVLIWDGPAIVSAVRQPVLNINATPPRGDVDRLLQLCPQTTNGQTVGAGHWIQLVVPDQVNAMIDRFLATAVPE